ncbi:hypothetical protein EDI_269370 [Entamoeba dispar SAW760]|uniref:Uncharacterized protein n=1 Tax=Entamoeba dispar (strain ATCC PRA-260 / SAW760) TaxID=370354 RepID=B0ERN6_ENTDS|nr:uncharacterized protein EDI_269370 [Entamoeba dispar SAW760]EDR22799.1 hypothetical protein EDI_269370 [Entamoeba dispar SAW760]|eukprot:EDR22799.1 hypothetical protein EDI_269370 [Entamoeba dispar SAW760]
MGKTIKRQISYHEISEQLKKEMINFEKEYKLIPTKGSIMKTYLKKLEKELISLHSILSLQVPIDNVEDQMSVLTNIFDIWRLLIDILRGIDQLLLPNVFYKLLTVILLRSEIQPHHLIINNPAMTDSNKSQFIEKAKEVKFLLYDTFYAMNNLMNEKQLILYGSMEIRLKPPKIEKKEKKKDNKDKDFKGLDKTPEKKRKKVDIMIKDALPQSAISPREDNKEFQPSQISDGESGVGSPRVINGDDLNEISHYEENSLLMTLNEQKRLSVLSKVLVKPLEEARKTKEENMTKKQKRLSAHFGVEIGAEDQFFFENNVSPIFVQFFPQYIAYTFFQIPEFRLELLQLIRDDNIVELGLKKCQNNEEMKEIKKRFPRVFGFDDMFDLLDGDENDIQEQYFSLKKNWMELFLPTSDFFMTFFYYYGQFVYYSLKGYDFELYGEIFGLKELIEVYVKQRIEKISEHSSLLMRENDKRCVLLHYPFILDYMIIKIIHNTNVYNIEQCDFMIESFSKWLNTLIEHQRFCTSDFILDSFMGALDKIFETDHFQLITSTIIMLFNSSYYFIGEPRIKLFVEFLTKKWFFTLFTHWNYYVRQAFHHFILYKFLFTRRSHLNWARFDKTETDVYKRQSSFGVNGEDIDRFVLASIDEKITSIRLVCDGDTNKLLFTKKVYCQAAFAEYEKALKLYNDWDKSKILEIPKIKPNLSEFDFENLN